jgi:hypothetical protein
MGAMSDRVNDAVLDTVGHLGIGSVCDVADV